jgi:hypothetical protein
MSARVSTHFVLRLAAVVIVSTLIGSLRAFADALTPESGGSPNADEIDALYKITLCVAIVIFLIVEGTLISSLVNHRARRGGPPATLIRANTPLDLRTAQAGFASSDQPDPPGDGSSLRTRSTATSTRGATTSGCSATTRWWCRSTPRSSSRRPHRT